MGTKHPSPPGTESTESRRAVGEALYRLAEAANRRSRDLSLTSVSTLHTLDLTGPRRITHLSVIEGVTQPSMTVLVSKLERLGLVERRADPADKRVALIALTASGSDYLQARRRAAADWFERLIDRLPVEEAEALVAATTALEHLYELEEQQRDRTTRSTARPLEVGR